MIRSIDKIDDVKMEFSVQITFRYLLSTVCNNSIIICVSFRQKWFDDRLAFVHKISQGMREKIKYLTITEPGKVRLRLERKYLIRQFLVFVFFAIYKWFIL